MRTLLIYLLLRLLIFAACFGVLMLLFGSLASPWLVALLALLFTSGLSLLLLREQTREAGRVLSGSVQGLRHRLAEFQRREDAD